MNNGMLPPKASSPVVDVRPVRKKNTAKTRIIITISDQLLEMIDDQLDVDVHSSRNAWALAAFREKLKRDFRNQDELKRLLNEVP